MHSLGQSLAVHDGHGDRPMVTDYGSKNIGRHLDRGKDSRTSILATTQGFGWCCLQRDNKLLPEERMPYGPERCPPGKATTRRRSGIQPPKGSPHLAARNCRMRSLSGPLTW